MTVQKLTPLQRRILERLTREGPHTFVALSHNMAIRTDTLNRAIDVLLEAGLIERCEVGQGGGVRVAQKESGDKNGYC
jgi:DNA-binding MarR family transcriptional regulator